MNGVCETCDFRGTVALLYCVVTEKQIVREFLAGFDEEQRTRGVFSAPSFS